ncbi:hypothetical protein EMIT0P228_290006 [Pseudomonas brassicacearum]
MAPASSHSLPNRSSAIGSDLSILTVASVPYLKSHGSMPKSRAPSVCQEPSWTFNPLP